MFRAQDQIYEPGTENVQPAVARDILSKIAQEAGLSEDQMTQCFNDKAAIQALQNRVEKYSRQDSIDSTPTFLINGKKLEGYQTMEQLDAAIQPLLK